MFSVLHAACVKWANVMLCEVSVSPCNIDYHSAQQVHGIVWENCVYSRCALFFRGHRDDLINDRVVLLQTDWKRRSQAPIRMVQARKNCENIWVNDRILPNQELWVAYADTLPRSFSLDPLKFRYRSDG